MAVIFGLGALSTAPVGNAFNHVFVGFITINVGSILSMNAYNALEADLMPSELRGRGYAILRLIESLVVVFGTMLGGYIYMINPRLPFIISVFLSIMALIVSIRLPETLRARTQNV